MKAVRYLGPHEKFPDQQQFAAVSRAFWAGLISASLLTWTLGDTRVSIALRDGTLTERGIDNLA